MKFTKFIVLIGIIVFPISSYALEFTGYAPQNLYSSGGNLVANYSYISDGHFSEFAVLFDETGKYRNSYSLVCYTNDPNNFAPGNDYYGFYNASADGIEKIRFGNSGTTDIKFVLHDVFGNTIYDQTIESYTGSGYGTHPTVYVFCAVLDFIEINDSNDPDRGIWLRSMTRYSYFGKTATRSFDSFTGTIQSSRSPDYGRKISNTYGSPYISYIGAYRLDFQAPYDQWSPDIPTENAYSNQRAKFIKDWLSGSGAIYGDVSNPLNYVYGTKVEQFVDSGSTNTDYFSECTSFIDVGCYIKGSYNAVKGFFTGLIPSIAWQGSMESCSGSGVITQNGVLAPLSNLIAILNPFPPPDGTTVCTLLGTQIIHYHLLVPEHNFFEVYAHGKVPSQLETSMYVMPGQTIIDVLVIVIFVYLSFSSLHKKND